jgi:hypothetical protein
MSNVLVNNADTHAASVGQLLTALSQAALKPKNLLLSVGNR